MTIKTIPALKARTHLGEIMQRSYKKGERFIVEKAGIPMVVILNAREYEEFARMMEEREERFKILDRMKDKIPLKASDEIESDVNEALDAVRQKRA